MTNTCLDAFKNLNIQIIDGTVAISPCCLSPVQKINKLNFVNDEYLNSFRKNFLEGKFSEWCKNCTDREIQGEPSRRQSSNQWYKDNDYFNQTVDLIRLDYWTGDTCNLRCVICGPRFSSSWKEELNLPLQSKVINKIWKDLNLKNIKFIHFNGGEPLLNKEHIKFLVEIPNKSQVHLNYNTNGTVLPSAKLLELWKNFKLVQIDFSIDDIGDRFEYQRYPAKWIDIEYNLKWFIKYSPVNCMFAVNTTLSILNQNNLNNLNRWLNENFKTNRVEDPVEYRTQPAFGLFSIDNVGENKDQIVTFLSACDSRRGTNWKTTFPELISILT